MDFIDLNDIENLKDRDRSFRIVIENKKYDTSHEDDLCRLVIKDKNWGKMLLIRYEYYVSKKYHGLGKGDMIFLNQDNNKLYAVELKSLKDQYSSTTDSYKVEKCISQSLKYAKAAKEWCGKEATPVTVIEYNNGEVRMEERYTRILRNAIYANVGNNDDDGILFYQGSKMPEDRWFKHEGDQTETTYKILGDTLEALRIVDNKQISSGSRKSFRKRVERVVTECTNCSKYLISIKHVDGDVLFGPEYLEVVTSN